MRVNIVTFIFFALLCVVAIAQECDQNPPWTYNYPQYSGRASWFDAVAQGGASPQTGACGWTKSTTDNVVGAYTGPTTSSMCKLCGNCYSITGPNGTQVVRVIDYCDTNEGACGVNVTPQWTLHEPVFVAVCGVTGLGDAPVTWYGPVPCPTPPGNLVYTGSSGSDPWYVAITIQGHRTPLQSVFFQSPGAGANVYYNVSRHQGNSWWINPPTPQQWPFIIRVVDVAGNVVEDTIQQSTMSGTPQTGTGGNFPIPAGGPSNTQSTTPSTIGSPTASRSVDPSGSPANSASGTSAASASPANSLSSGASPSQSSTTAASASIVVPPSSPPSSSSSNSFSSETSSVSTSPSSSSSTTPSASPAPALPNLVVYDDALRSPPFNSWSWAKTFSFNNSAPVASGSRSISYTPKEYDALYFSCFSCGFNTSYYGISFYVHGGTEGNQKVQVQVVGGDFGLTGGSFDVNPVANQWTRIEVPLSSLRPKPGNLGGFWIQSLQGDTPAGVMYIDQIVLISSSGSATITMPPVQNRPIRAVNSAEDLIAAFTAVFPDITTFSVSKADPTQKRDLEATVVTAVGLNADQVNRISKTEEWVPLFNDEAGTNVDPTAVVARVVQPTPAEEWSSGVSRIQSWMNLFVL